MQAADDSSGENGNPSPPKLIARQRSKCDGSPPSGPFAEDDRVTQAIEDAGGETVTHEIDQGPVTPRPAVRSQVHARVRPARPAWPSTPHSVARAVENTQGGGRFGAIDLMAPPESATPPRMIRAKEWYVKVEYLKL